MNKKTIILITSIVLCIALIVFAIKSIPPKVEQPSFDLINSPQPIDGTL